MNLRRLLRDPERWVDSDMTREEWVLLAKHLLAFSAAMTALTILLGVVLL